MNNDGSRDDERMGWLSKRVFLPRCDDTLAVAGVSRYQVPLRWRIGTHDFQLVREPDNPVDPNAVMVLFHGKGLVGYLPAEDAALFSSFIAGLERLGGQTWVKGVVRKARLTDKFVVLDVPKPALLREQLAEWAEG